MMDYCQNVMTCANALRNIGHGVSESQLLLNLLRGQNRNYYTTTGNITDSKPLPMFAEARSMLFVEELRLADEIKVAADTAIIATVSRGSGSDNCDPTLPTGFGGSAPTSGASSSSSNKYGNRRGVCNCSVTGGQQQQQTTSQQGGPRPSGPSVCFPPMGYLVQQLSTARHRHPRLLHQQQAHTMFAPSNFSTLQQQSWASPSPASPPLSRCRCRIDHGSWTLARPHICL